VLSVIFVTNRTFVIITPDLFCLDRYTSSSTFQRIVASALHDTYFLILYSLRNFLTFIKFAGFSYIYKVRVIF